MRFSPFVVEIDTILGDLHRTYYTLKFCAEACRMGDWKSGPNMPCLHGIAGVATFKRAKFSMCWACVSRDGDYSWSRDIGVA